MLLLVLIDKRPLLESYMLLSDVHPHRRAAMSSRPSPPKIVRHLTSSEKLTIKDGLREVRFNLRHGARNLVRAVEEATHRHGESGQNPIEALGNFAVQTTAMLLSNIDHAAVDLLAQDDAPYRSMIVPLRSSASYFVGPLRSDDLRLFARDHHWRLRHWLTLTRQPDVFVHEKAIEAAGAHVLDLIRTGHNERVDLATTCTESHLPVAVLVMQALACPNIFSKPALASPVLEGQLVSLATLGAVVSVLAGEIASVGKGELNARNQSHETLRLADEIAIADRAGWELAHRSLNASEATSRWLAFVLRHV